MHGMPVTELIDLLAATESVRNKDGCGCGRVHGWQKSKIRNGFGDFELVSLKPERARHAATCGVDLFHHRTRLAQECDFTGRPAKHSLVVAMTVQQHLRALKPASNPFRRICRQPIG
jgi:hypothetical protein